MLSTRFVAIAAIVAMVACLILGASFGTSLVRTKGTVAYLEDRLLNGDLGECQVAADALAGIFDPQDSTRDTTGILYRGLQKFLDNDYRRSSHIALAMARLGSPAVPYLKIELKKDAQGGPTHMALFAAFAQMRIGEAADAREELMRFISWEDPTGEMRRAIASAGFSYELLNALEKARQKKDYTTQENCVIILSEIGQDAVAASRDQLMAVVKDRLGGDNARLWAVGALGRLKDYSLVPFFQEVGREDPSGDVQREAFNAVWEASVQREEQTLLASGITLHDIIIAYQESGDPMNPTRTGGTMLVSWRGEKDEHNTDALLTASAKRLWQNRYNHANLNLAGMHVVEKGEEPFPGGKFRQFFFTER